jgi:hypothetical protein
MTVIGPEALELAKTIVNQLEQLSELGVDDKTNIPLTLGQLRMLAKSIVSLKEENKDAKEQILLIASEDFRAEHQTSPFTEDFVTIGLVCSWLEKRAKHV